MEFVEVKESVTVTFGRFGFRVASPTFDFTKLSLGEIVRIAGMTGGIIRINNSSTMYCQRLGNRDGDSGIYESFEIEHGAYYRMKGD